MIKAISGVSRGHHGSLHPLPNGVITKMYRFGDFRLDVNVRRLFYKDNPLPLSTKTFDILKLLVRRRGRLVTKEELLKRVWPQQHVEGNNLTVRMSELRKALGESPENKYIETVPGSGYRFVAKVLNEARPDIEDRGGAFGSLAVLPFAVEGNVQRLHYISEGILEGLINRLASLPDLKIMARSTVTRFRDKSCDPQEVAEELGVEGIVTGRLSQAGSTVVLSVELTDAEDGAYVWGERFRRNFTEIFALQDEITEELAAGLRLRLTRDERARLVKRHTHSQEAYNLYLKGRYYYNNKRSVEGIQKAAAFFRQAIKEDPGFASAHSGLADCYLTFVVYGLAPPRKFMPQSRASALRAIKLDESLGHAHATLATVKANFEWDWAGAQKEYERAIELGPNDAHIHHVYGNYLVKVGRLEEAVAELKRAKELDPLSLNINVGLGKIYYMARQYEEGIKQCLETLEIEPDFSPASGVLGLIYMQRGQYAQAAAEIKKVVTSSAGSYAVPDRGGKRQSKHITFESDPEALGLLGRAYALGGRPREARKILAGLLKMSAARYIEPHAVALVYIALGDNDKAFEWFEKSFRDRSATLTYIKIWPEIDSLRTDPRYRELVSRMGLQP